MQILSLFLVKLNSLLLLQPGELPVPRKTRKDQEFGNFTLNDFLSENWLYLTGVLFIIALLVFYLKQTKKEREEKGNG